MKRTLLILIMCLGLVLSACGGAVEEAAVEEAAIEEPAEEEGAEEAVEEAAAEEVVEEIQAAPPAETKDMIVFASNRGDDPAELGLYLLDLESKQITPVETGFEACVLPKWSPDGNSILFGVMDIWNLYTVMPDGSELTQITDFRSNNADWSPDGTQIVFQSDHQNEPQDTPDIYIIDITGENLVEILDDPPNIDYSPRWSPDGKRILFISSKSGKEEMFTMNVDGSDVVQLSESADQVIEAVWSPDGTRIVFAYGPYGRTDLFIADADDVRTNEVRLTNDQQANMHPTWSPDGKRIVFSSTTSGSTDLWMIDADGTNLVQLTDDAFEELFPDWSP
jgi:TolB protein